MRPASAALVAYLAAQRAAKDATTLLAVYYTFTLRTGTLLTYTNLRRRRGGSGNVLAT